MTAFVPPLKFIFSESELEQSKVARRLISAIEDGIVQSPGQLAGWCNAVWFLPAEWKNHVWLELSAHIDHHQFKELYGFYRHNEARYKSDMERRKSRKRRSEGAGE